MNKMRNFMNKMCSIFANFSTTFISPIFLILIKKTMNFRLIVSVEEGTKTLIGPKVPNINDCFTFEDLFKKVTLDTFTQRDIETYGRIDAKSKWIPIEKCFDGELEIIKNLKF